MIGAFLPCCSDRLVENGMILKQILNGRQFSSFVLIKENENNSAHHFLRKAISSHLARGNSVRLHSYENPDARLYTEFLSHKLFRFVNQFGDPWNNSDAGKKELRTGSNCWVPEPSEGYHVVVIDSICCALLEFSLEEICCRLQELRDLNDENRRCQVISVVDTSVLSESSPEFQEINRLAESVLTLGHFPLTKHVDVVHRKRFGKTLFGVYKLSLAETGEVEYEEVQKESLSSEKPPAESAPEVVSTFKLTLDVKEKESRSRVVLPYLKNVGGGGGKIIYEPDDLDEWDDEDPDDDLEI